MSYSSLASAQHTQARTIYPPTRISSKMEKRNRETLEHSHRSPATSVVRATVTSSALIFKLAQTHGLEMSTDYATNLLRLSLSRVVDDRVMNCPRVSKELSHWNSPVPKAFFFILGRDQRGFDVSFSACASSV